MRVLVVGASRKPERYSYLAMKRLLEKKHEVVLFHPSVEEIEGHPVVNSLKNVESPLDTITLYVGTTRVEQMADDLIACSPRRIISNPGTESEVLKSKAIDAGIEYIEACTLVMLSTDQF